MNKTINTSLHIHRETMSVVVCVCCCVFVVVVDISLLLTTTTTKKRENKGADNTFFGVLSSYIYPLLYNYMYSVPTTNKQQHKEYRKGTLSYLLISSSSSPSFHSQLISLLYSYIYSYHHLIPVVVVVVVVMRLFLLLLLGFLF